MPPAERHFVLLHHKAVPASAAHTSRHCPKTQCILPATPQRQNCVRWLFPRSFYVRHGFAFLSAHTSHIAGVVSVEPSSTNISSQSQKA